MKTKTCKYTQIKNKNEHKAGLHSSACRWVLPLKGVVFDWLLVAALCQFKRVTHDSRPLTSPTSGPLGCCPSSCFAAGVAGLV